MRAADPESRATCSPLACLGTKAASARCVSPRLADLSGKASCCTPCGLYRPMPEVVVVTPVPLRAVFHLKRDSHDFGDVTHTIS